MIFLATALVYFSLNFQDCLHIGHRGLSCEVTHLTMQCIWKQWEQAPQTKGQSSPGREQSGQVASKAILLECKSMLEFHPISRTVSSILPANTAVIIVCDPFPNCNAHPTCRNTIKYWSSVVQTLIIDKEARNFPYSLGNCGNWGKSINASNNKNPSEYCVQTDFDVPREVLKGLSQLTFNRYFHVN